jgi:uncharacterized membrane protein
MIDALFWGSAIIIGTSISAIIVVLGIYYLITKNIKKNDLEKHSYTLDSQKEVK